MTMMMYRTSTITGKKMNEIKNPLPVPPKREHKTDDFDLPYKDGDDFDVTLSESDDFDLKEPLA